MFGCAPDSFIKEIDQNPVPTKTEKPKKQFITKEEMGKYIEGFKVKYKTEICKNWEKTGDCEFKDSCSFAHGLHELKRKTDIHKNYKTKQCKKFKKDGVCPYGTRCQFLHDEKIDSSSSKIKMSAKITIAPAKTKKKSKPEQKSDAKPIVVANKLP